MELWEEMLYRYNMKCSHETPNSESCPTPFYENVEGWNCQNLSVNQFEKNH